MLTVRWRFVVSGCPRAPGSGDVFSHPVGLALTKLHGLREQSKMTWIAQGHGWLAAPEDIVAALSKDGLEG